jgi:hypothetical protein
MCEAWPKPRAPAWLLTCYAVPALHTSTYLHDNEAWPVCCKICMWSNKGVLIKDGMTDRESRSVVVKLYPHSLSGGPGLDTNCSLWEDSRYLQTSMMAIAHVPQVGMDWQTAESSPSSSSVQLTAAERSRNARDTSQDTANRDLDWKQNDFVYMPSSHRELRSANVMPVEISCANI